MELLKDGSEDSRSRRERFIEHVRKGKKPSLAASWVRLPLEILYGNANGGDTELKEALDEGSDLRPKRLPGVPVYELPAGPSAKDMRAIALNHVFPRIMGKVEQILEDLDPNRETNEKHWKEDRKLCVELLGKMVQLLPKEKQSRPGDDEEVKDFTLEEINERMLKLKDREDELLDQGEMAQVRSPRILDQGEVAS